MSTAPDESWKKLEGNYLISERVWEPLKSNPDKPLLVERILELVDEEADTVEAHPLALMVEVKVLVVSWESTNLISQKWEEEVETTSRTSGLIEPVHGELKGILDGFLVALLIDEVNQVDIAIELELVVDVLLKGFGLGMREGMISLQACHTLHEEAILTVSGLSMTSRSGW